jgi:hypothetical protein
MTTIIIRTSHNVVLHTHCACVFVLRCLASVTAFLLANPWSGVLPNISCLYYRPLGLIHDRIVKSKGPKGKWEEEQRNTVWLQNKFLISASSLSSHLLRSFACGSALLVVEWTVACRECVCPNSVWCPPLSQSILTVRCQTRACFT